MFHSKYLILGYEVLPSNCLHFRPFQHQNHCLQILLRFAVLEPIERMESEQAKNYFGERKRNLKMIKITDWRGTQLMNRLCRHDILNEILLTGSQWP